MEKVDEMLKEAYSNSESNTVIRVCVTKADGSDWIGGGAGTYYYKLRALKHAGLFK